MPPSVPKSPSVDQEGFGKGMLFPAMIATR